MLEAAELDVRQIAPRERHSIVFATFDRLQSGEAFLLVNDHNPVRLLQEFQTKRPGQTRWEPQEEGPERWVIRIGKALPDVDEPVAA